jgi:hypothetical protein
VLISVIRGLGEVPAIWPLLDRPRVEGIDALRVGEHPPLLILVGAHDGEHARRLGGVARVLRSVANLKIVVVHLCGVGLAVDFEQAEVMLAVRIVATVELVEGSNHFEDSGL